MGIEIKKLFDEEDIKIHDEGIFVKDIFFDKKRIADTFNELILMRDFIETHSVE